MSHGYKPFGTIGRAAWQASARSLGDSGPCNVDVACPLGADWQNEKRGVVILLSGGSGFCTGSLINDTANDCRPYVLTAAHCSAGSGTAFGFNFERQACGAGDPGAPTTQMISGATVRGDDASSDFTLLEMSALPPATFGFYLNGWSRDPGPAATTWVIHHPSGDVKKISHDADPPTDGLQWGATHWRIGQYEEGTTEPGSSGAPLLDQNHRIVGQLHGGTASCSSLTYDEYGKVSASWGGGGTAGTRLSDWLDPLGTGAIVWEGLDGASCYFQPAGSVSLNRSRYACMDSVGIHLRDDNLAGQPTQEVSLSSTTEPAPETVTLGAVAEGSGEFQGTFPLAAVAAAHGDGQVSVADGDTITVTYVDADDGLGHTGVPRTATAMADCAPPRISEVLATGVTESAATITWRTDEASTSVVHYGAAPPGTSTSSIVALVASHGVTLAGLSECTTFYYWVESSDGTGNQAYDDASGAFYTFTTERSTLPASPCGPHASVVGIEPVHDACDSGGAGDADGNWDAGEQVQFSVRIEDDGTTPLTGITATLVPTTPGVAVIDAVAAYPDLAAGATADSLAPQFTAKLRPGLGCGEAVSFDATIRTNEGTWIGSTAEHVGRALAAAGTALDESFASGIPATWAVDDGGSGGGAAATWTTANPGSRIFTAPILAPAAVVDSAGAGPEATQDEQLITPVLDLSAASSVTLEFDQYFRWYGSGQSEIGDVDVGSSLTGETWVNVYRRQGASTANPDHRVLDLTAQAAGAPDAQIRFHYYQASYEWYWEVDNVKVTTSAPGSCQTNPCAIPAGPPPPVPDGSFGLPMRAGRAEPDGTSIELSWDVATCVAANYKALYGSLAHLPTYGVDGAACALGTAGGAIWNGVPAGDLWFTIVATDGSGTEGTWGVDGSGGPEGGTAPSGQCGDSARENLGSCP